MAKYEYPLKFFQENQHIKLDNLNGKFIWKSQPSTYKVDCSSNGDIQYCAIEKCQIEKCQGMPIYFLFSSHLPISQLRIRTWEMEI